MSDREGDTEIRIQHA